MKYSIVLEDTADAELLESYDWGVKLWGEQRARRWISKMLREIKTLSIMPERCSIAIEDHKFDETIRQMIVGRYRILFAIRGRKVHILHVRGAFSETADDA